ncbi:MAG: hypothetical protein DRP74_00540 [Candidatus Omnitrophota bacterium]|nr:MAG: hypothetical protein DRP74_00540 [Candidatus Omnitrophota bacterium]
MRVMKLTDGVTSIEFSPAKGFEVPEDRPRTAHKTLDGELYIYEWGNKRKYVVPVTKISRDDRDIFVGWWQNLTKLTFYPDLKYDPTDSISVRIINEERPLQAMFDPGWETYFEGELILREVS